MAVSQAQNNTQLPAAGTAQQNGAPATTQNANAGTPAQTGDQVVAPVAGQTLPTPPASSVQPRQAAQPRVIPLDVVVPTPKELTDMTAPMPHMVNGRTELKDVNPYPVGGQYSSRMEAETKTRVPLSKVAEVYQALDILTYDPIQRDMILGPGWTVTPMAKYYVKDNAGNIKFGADGLPEVHPMRDRYYDDLTGTLAKSGTALRLREFLGDKFGKINVKPDQGAMTPDNIARRIEKALDVVKGARDNPQILVDFLLTEHPLNPFRDVFEVHAQLKNRAALEQILHPSMDIVDKRYKFHMQHTNGTEIEMSLDNVAAIAFDRTQKGTFADGTPEWEYGVRMDKNGKPMVARYAQLEMDLEHLNVNAQGVSPGQGGNATGEQGYPAVHNRQDINNKELVASEAFKLLKQVAVPLQEYALSGVVGKDITSAPQKYALAALIAGISGTAGKDLAEESAASQAFQNRVATQMQKDGNAIDLMDVAF